MPHTTYDFPMDSANGKWWFLVVLCSLSSLHFFLFILVSLLMHHLQYFCWQVPTTNINSECVVWAGLGDLSYPCEYIFKALNFDFIRPLLRYKCIATMLISSKNTWLITNRHFSYSKNTLFFSSKSKSFFWI